MVLPTPGQDVIVRSADRTKLALLTVAERLFGTQGIHQTSTRQITGAAGTSPDAVNYHFGSKSGLVRAVLERRVTELSGWVDAALGECRPDGRFTTEDVARALAMPALKMASLEDGCYYHAFLAALVADPSMSAILRRESSPQFLRLEDAMRRARPELREGQRVQLLALGAHAVMHAVGSGPLARWLVTARDQGGDEPMHVLLAAIEAILASPVQGSLSGRQRPSTAPAPGGQLPGSARSERS